MLTARNRRIRWRVGFTADGVDLYHLLCYRVRRGGFRRFQVAFVSHPLRLPWTERSISAVPHYVVDLSVLQLGAADELGTPTIVAKSGCSCAPASVPILTSLSLA